MKARLIVKNFGPIKSVDLELRNVNVFIGPQASGKSALAKIYTICKSPLSFYNKSNGSLEKSNLTDSTILDSNILNFHKSLEDYNILSFLGDDSFIEFHSELHYFKFESNQVIYDRKFLRKIELLESHSKLNIEATQTEVINIICEFYDKLLYFDFFIQRFFNLDKLSNTKDLKKYLSEKTLTYDQLQVLINEIKSIENELSSNAALYIPAERNFITIIKGASLNLLNNNVPIPKHILTFGAEFEKASFNKKELDLGFIKSGLIYKNENGIDYIYHLVDKAIKLTESASGLQSIVPLLLPILSKREANKISHKSYVIEEPELNLFPKAQYELIKVLETGRFDSFAERQDIGTIHTYTTHSPYILSAFNNLLYAGNVVTMIRRKLYRKDVSWADSNKISEYEVNKILPTYIDSENFSGYQIFDGGASSIFNTETGLIKENFIDESSDEMGDDFDALMELMNKEL